MSLAERNPRSWLRFVPALLLLILFVIGLSTGLAKEFSLSSLKAHHHELHVFALDHPVLAAGLFVGVFVVVVASGLPVALILTVASGAIFGPVLGALLTMFSATLGATITYAASRLAAGSNLQARIEVASPAVHRIIEGFGRNTFSHILTMRLIPLFPFGPVNIAAGLARVPTWPFVLATLLGEVPTASIYAFFGAGLGRVIGKGERPGFHSLHDPMLVLPMVGLALLSLAPTVIGWITRRMKASAPGPREQEEIG